MMEMYIYCIFYSILYVILCEMFVESFEEKKEKLSKINSCLINIFFIVVIYYTSVKFAFSFFMKEFFVLGFSIFFIWRIFRQKPAKITIIVLLYHGGAFLIDYTCVIVMSRILSIINMEQFSDPATNFLVEVLSHTIIFCCIMLIRKFFARKSYEVLTDIEWIRFSVFPIFTIIVLVVLLTYFDIPHSSKEKNILVCISFGLLLMNIIVFSLIHDILKREMQIREDRIIMERVKNETGMYRSISENYDKQRKREHEYKNQLTFIAALARENKVDEINRYLKKYTDEILSNTNLIDTHHVIVNAILNAKYQETKAKGITFVIKVNDLSDLRIEDEDIVLILSNLLNNAIEANEKKEGAIIKVKFVREGRQSIISVSNTYVREPVVEGSQFVTTKTEDVKRHGIGIENIRETVDKYGGSCVIKYDEKYFRVSVLIPD